MLAKHALSQLSYSPNLGMLGRRTARLEPKARKPDRAPRPVARGAQGDGRRRRRLRQPNMVGLGRLERPTSPLSGVRSNHLSYRPEPVPPAQRTSPRPVQVQAKSRLSG